MDDEVRRFLTSRPPRLEGALVDGLALDAIDDDTLLRRRPGHPCVLVDRGERLEVLLGRPDPRRTGPAPARPRGGPPPAPSCGPRDLPLDEQSRLVLARTAGPGRAAQGRPADDERMSFRCAVASEARTESMAGTASTVRSFLLVEHPGPWGVDALRDARMPEGIGPELAARTQATRTKVVMIRRPGGGSRTTGGVRVFGGYTHHSEPWVETTVLDDLHGVHDLDLEALGGRPVDGAGPAPRPGAGGLHARPPRHLLRRAGPPGGGRPRGGVPRGDLGGLAHRRRPVRRPTCWSSRTASTSDASTRPRRAGVARLLAAGELDLDHLRGRSGLATPLQAAEAALRRYVDERRLDTVRFVSRQVDGGRTDAVFDVAGRRYAVRGHDQPRQRPADAHLLARCARIRSCTTWSTTSGRCDVTAVLRRSAALLGAAHPGPAFAVTLLAGLLAGAVGLGAGRRHAGGARRPDRAALHRLVQRPRRPGPRPRGGPRGQAAGRRPGLRAHGPHRLRGRRAGDDPAVPRLRLARRHRSSS